MKAFSQAEFLASSAGPADMPPPGPPEIAFAGRSNVGKSSAINALAGRKRLAFTIKTPGRTQTINFFRLGDDARLVDLPGYGYAKVPQAMREQWRTLVGSYITSRDTLAGVVLVMDARHPLTDLDVQLIHFLGDVPLLALLSKADKLTREQQTNALASVKASLRAEATLFSSLTRQGVEECRDLLERWLAAGRGNKKPPVKGI
ncbi:MAG TPA: ribosome biogenesis GTP-binding protein YihA/YsxC [Burkholderiales bacterium]|nr:ribosome biogenesis GTP-binding protein YihA/YsxC [Burkholderiales bacterium]